MKPTNETPKQNPRVLLTREEVAKLLNCSLRKVDYLREQDGLPCIKLGALVRFDQDDVFRWLDNRKQGQKGSMNQPPFSLVPDLLQWNDSGYREKP